MCYTRALGQYSAWENSLRCPRTRTLSTPTEMSLLCVPLCTSLTRAAQQPAGRPVQTMLCDAWRQCRRCGILRPQPARFECVVYVLRKRNHHITTSVSQQTHKRTAAYDINVRNLLSSNEKRSRPQRPQVFFSGGLAWPGRPNARYIW